LTGKSFSKQSIEVFYMRFDKLAQLLQNKCLSLNTFNGQLKEMMLTKQFLFMVIYILMVFLFTELFVRGLNASADDDSLKEGMKTQYIPAKKCGECHQKIYSQWEKSMHAHALDDPIFKASYAQAYVKTGGGAKKICLRCHAPTTLLTLDYDQELDITQEGVTCDFCHSVVAINTSDTEESFVMSPVKTGHKSNEMTNRPFHSGKSTAFITSSEFCGGCHEYNDDSGIVLMGTYTEWKESPYAKQGVQCKDCHTPHDEGAVKEQSTVKFREAMIHGSALTGTLSLERETKAIDTHIHNVERNGGNVTVFVQLSNTGSGHKVPTGIPSRNLVLICEVKTMQDGKTMIRQKVYSKKVVDQRTGKAFMNDSDLLLGPGRIVEDNRLGPFETRTEKFKFMVDPDKNITVKAYLNYVYQPVLMQKTEMKIHVSGDQKDIPALHKD
jgi:hypothetical protein